MATGERCFNCEGFGHIAKECPSARRDSIVLPSKNDIANNRSSNVTDRDIKQPIAPAARLPETNALSAIRSAIKLHTAREWTLEENVPEADVVLELLKDRGIKETDLCFERDRSARRAKDSRPHYFCFQTRKNGNANTHRNGNFEKGA